MKIQIVYEAYTGEVQNMISREESSLKEAL